MHEIVTIQIGRQANFVGTHFWNAQESYHTFGSDEISPVNHDIHFRQGTAPDGSDTYLPRALIYDLRGGFGSLATVNALGAEVEEVQESSAWNGALTRLQNAPTEPSPFLRSLVAQQAPVFPTAATTRYFSDFAATFYHPRSLVPVTPAHPVLETLPSSSSSQQQTSSTNDGGGGGLPSFSTHADGVRLFEATNTTGDGDTVYDRDLRRWVEECDSLQAVQLLTSSDDAWGGFASAYVEDMRDQLGAKGSVWVWGTDGLENQQQQSQSLSTKRLKVVNQTLALAAFNAHASLYIPMSLPSSAAASLDNRRHRTSSTLRLDTRVLWHTSALVSAAFESATLPTRLRASSGGGRVPVLGDWEDALGDGGRRRIAELGLETGSAGGTGDDTMTTNGHNSDHMTTTNGAQTDSRISQIQDLEQDEGEEQEAINAPLPIELFRPSGGSGTMRSTTGRALRSKTFARLEVLRGRGWSSPWSSPSSTSSSSSIANEQDLRFLRRGRPIAETYQTDTPLLPLVATFPHIFTDAVPPTAGRTAPVPGLRVRTGLRTSSSVANWVRAVESMLRRMPLGLLADMMGDGEEKEGVRNELQSVAEMYVEGWDSADEGSDDDDE